MPAANSNVLSNSGAVYVLHGDGKLITQRGTNGNDTIKGDASANNIATGVGDDTIAGNGGNDAIYAGPGSDTITISDVDSPRRRRRWYRYPQLIENLTLNLADKSARVRR